MVVLKNEEMETLDEEFHDSVENVNDIIAIYFRKIISEDKKVVGLYWENKSVGDDR